MFLVPASAQSECWHDVLRCQRALDLQQLHFPGAIVVSLRIHGFTHMFQCLQLLLLRLEQLQMQRRVLDCRIVEQQHVTG